MTNFEGIRLMIGAMVIVFLVLIGLMISLKISAFLLSVKPKPEEETMLPTESSKQKTVSSQEAMAAVMAALVVTNKEEQDKQYEIVSIKRVR
ncbi:OadG family protein [Enterococcus massiliensis]|uniref:OadG family protein n=1 Tax=Enterococcus massiliensis TaxID=1640685 RepID=UPI00065DF536|nr:OadG family protein [Enterococcus massiliensis]